MAGVKHALYLSKIRNRKYILSVVWIVLICSLGTLMAHTLFVIEDMERPAARGGWSWGCC